MWARLEGPGHLLKGGEGCKEEARRQPGPHATHSGACSGLLVRGTPGVTAFTLRNSDLEGLFPPPPHLSGAQVTLQGHLGVSCTGRLPLHLGAQDSNAGRQSI